MSDRDARRVWQEASTASYCSLFVQKVLQKTCMNSNLSVTVTLPSSRRSPFLWVAAGTLMYLSHPLQFPRVSFLFVVVFASSLTLKNIVEGPIPIDEGSSAQALTIGVILGLGFSSRLDFSSCLGLSYTQA